MINSVTKFSSVVPFIKSRLKKHHEIYSGKCKAELWEEVCAGALKESGHGSDWAPDFNHFPGIDQTTTNGVTISNKGGKLSNDGKTLNISGSRLTRYRSLLEKVDYLSKKREDYIFCLSSKDCDDITKYYFVVIDASKLTYGDCEWKEVSGSRKNNKNTIVGYSADGVGFSAKIQRSMSDQLWTTIDVSLFTEFHEVEL